MNIYLKTLEQEFVRNGDSTLAKGQAKYMRDKFNFHGMKSPLRRLVSRPFLLKDSIPEKSELDKHVRALWKNEFRDSQYFAMELAGKYLKETSKEDIILYEFMIVNKSWWDTVDFIASTLVGNYFMKFPETKESITEKWINSGNIWLQRTVLIFQLKYKEQVDLELLERSIKRLNGTKEFFINKAIGWALRSYARVDPDYVRSFVESLELSNLSRREALKHLV